MNNKISIIGCGWLGLPLAIFFHNNGYMVNGSTTTPEKLKTLDTQGIIPHLIKLDIGYNSGDLKDLLNCDTIIVCIPPGRINSENYPYKMKSLVGEISQSAVKNIIYISSTSVYEDCARTVYETDVALELPPEKSVIKISEEIFLGMIDKKVTIIRFGGLIGPNRHPGRFFAGKTNIPGGKSPINLIHLDDCIGIINHIVKNNLWNQIYNAAAPSHPTKSSFYGLASKLKFNQPAIFIEESAPHKVIDPAKIISSGYIFKYPDLENWLIEDQKSEY